MRAETELEIESWTISYGLQYLSRTERLDNGLKLDSFDVS